MLFARRFSCRECGETVTARRGPLVVTSCNDCGADYVVTKAGAIFDYQEFEEMFPNIQLPE